VSSVIDSPQATSALSDNWSMQPAFGIVVWVVCAVAVLVGLVGLFLSRRTWDEYEKNQLVLDTDESRAPAPGSPTALLERDVEIRQLLDARNDRRRRRGESPIDVDQELARLTAPQIDPAPEIDAELRAEIRDLVIARNYRRARAGQPPLEVAVEVQRQIEELRGL
jgi:hypothetical protein